MSDLRTAPGFGVEYATRPSRPRSSRSRRGYELFIGGQWVAPRAARTCRRSTRPPKRCSPSSPTRGPTTSMRPCAPHATRGPRGPRCPAKERAKYVYRIARQLLERAREFAVLETLDGGKPIKESRDVDIPLAAAHFFYYAGWADKLEYAAPGASPRPLGVAGQIIPWNFPLLMAAWKLAPALATGNVCVLKPAETTPLTALLLAQVCEDAGAAARRRQHRHRRPRDGCRARRAPRRRQDRVHRFHRGRQGDPERRSPAPARR